MQYLEESGLEVIFEIIAQYYSKKEEVPIYIEEHDGIQKLRGVFQGVRMDHFYPAIYDKITYLFTQINKDHFFSNGNKRLALVCATLFAVLNGYKFRSFTKEEYREKIKLLFPKFDNFEDDSMFNSEAYALYNLSILVADSYKYIPQNDFDTLKAGVKLFFEFCLELEVMS